MNRMEKFGSVAVALLFAAQIWTLHRVEMLADTQFEDLSASVDPSDKPESPIIQLDGKSPSPDVHQQLALLNALKKIEARLAIIEKSTHNSHLISDKSLTSYAPTNNERMAADQRLNSLLPSGPLSREDYARLNADIQALPSDERFAVATALSRAINDGRVQMAPGAL